MLASPALQVGHDDRAVLRRWAQATSAPASQVQRARILLLAAEGVPASGGYLMPLYRNPMFTPGGDGEAGARFRPEPGGPLDYSDIICPVAEHVCETVCWFNHVLLLADELAIHAAADAVAKVCENAGEFRRLGPAGAG